MSATETHYRGLERMYHAAPINKLLESTLNVEKGSSTILSTVQLDYFHAAGSMHGCLYFKALDDAAYFAAASRNRSQFLVTTGFTTYITRAVSEGPLTTKGRLISAGKQLLVAEAVMYDPRGREVARGSGTFMPSGKLLAEQPGYTD
ncbi:PaaI family thioesterase [Pontibacterium sinense]|nr:PaaI family thioesterase [Pontibacterium sinense]